MIRNMGVADRAIRILAGLVVAGLYFTGRISGTLAIILGVFAAVFILTGLVAFCPGYLPFGFSTAPRPPAGVAPKA